MSNPSKQNLMIKSNNDEKGYDRIEDRIQQIKNLLGNHKLKTMVNFDAADTENFENRTKKYDIRTVMKKETFEFNKLICDIGGKLLYIKSGTTGHTFKGIIYDEDGSTELLNYAVKVVAYPIRENYGDVNDIARPENAELMMLKVLSYFVVNGQSPHIVLPIGTFNTSIKPFIALAKSKIVENKKYDNFVKRYKQSEYHDDVSILISEWANGGDLLDYIKNNYKNMKLRDWRTIFFQIVSVLAIIQNKYPAFRHNDLKANNILVQKIQQRDKNNYFLYKLNTNNTMYEFLVPNIGIQIKLWDFDFACIPGVVNNSKVSADWTDKINVKPEQHRYYDLHYFFNTLTKKGFFPEFWDSPEIHHSVKKFVRDIVPEKYANPGDEQLVTDRGRILTNDEYTTPFKILTEHEFFDKMRPQYSKVKKSTKTKCSSITDV
jgi:serine/threonine protein kinase